MTFDPNTAGSEPAEHDPTEGDDEAPMILDGEPVVWAAVHADDEVQ